MYRNQFRPDRFNDNTNAARRTGRGCIGGTHHWVVSGGRGSAAPGTRLRSPPNRSGRPGTVQQYRPRSPASVVPQGNATNYTPVVSAADEHTEPVNRGSVESQKSPNAPDQSDVVNLESAEGVRAEDSSMPTIHSEGYSSSAFTLQFGTLSPGVITKQCIPCSTSAPPDLNEKKHEKCQAHHGLLSDEPNVVSMPSAGEQQKQETKDNLIIRSQTDSIDTYDSVPAMVSSNSCVLAGPVLPHTPGLYYVAPAEKVSMDSCKVFPRNPSSPTHQQWQKQDTRKEATQSDTMHKYPASNPKMSVQIPPPYTPSMAPPSFMLPVNGRPLPAAFQQKQPQVPVEFRGQGVPMGNAPHVPPFFVHGAQARALQPPAFVHQGQGLGCAPPACPHLPQLGNMRITQELPQQQARSSDEQKRPIRITHPDTHEELMLDRRGHSYIDAASGAMPLHHMNQPAQPVTTFPPLHEVYYQPNMYNTGHIYLPTTNAVPASNRQMCPRVQTPRHSLDPNINNQAVTSISPPMQNPWLGASSRLPTNLRSASEVSSSKGLLPSDVSFPGQGALKPPTIFLAENNELSSQTGTPTCAVETPTMLRYSVESALSSQQRVHKLGLEISPQPEKLVSEANLKLPAATSGLSCSTSPQSVLTQQAQTGSALVDRVTSIAGPQNISACKLTSVCVASGTSSVEAKLESSAVPSATSSSGAKGQLYHIVPQSEMILDTESKNSKYDGNSILGKPPMMYTQETLPPKSPTTSIFTESLKARVNHVTLPETSEANCSAPLQMQDLMREEHTVNAEVTCSKSKAEQVDMTMHMPSASSGSRNGTDVSKLVNVPTCAESGDLHLSLHIGNVSPSDKNNGSSSDVQIGSCSLNDSIQDNENIPMIMAIASNSTSAHKKIERGSIDSVVSNQCSVAAASVVQTKKPVLEASKPKTTHGRRKKRKEILPKSSDSAEEVVQSSLTVDKEICTLDAEMGSSAGSNDNQNKNDIFDWEGDMEISRDNYGYDQKRYSRDFLLTFAQSCVNLPEGFKIGSDIHDAIMNVGSEHNPNRERTKDRVSTISQANRHMGSNKLNDNNWRKLHPPFSGRDPLSGRGSSRKGSQNQLPNQYNGEILSRAMKEVACQRSMSRGSVDQRWQHRTNQAMSSPSQVSMPVMHKAEKKYEIGKVSDEEEVKQRQLKAILNKLTPQNFEKLFEQVKALNIDNIITLNGVISQIFDKALMEPTFCEMYASFCFSLAGELPNFVKDDEKITFKRLLLNKCQEEFERGEREQAEAEKTEEEGGMKQSENEREEKRLRVRRRMLGNIRLIGELYKKKMLTERIMHECIKKLLGEYQHPDEEDLEALCKLMSTIGEMIDHIRAKVHMDFYFDIIQKLSANSKLSSRIRFMLEDVIDLRNNKWRQRRKVEGPKKIEEVRRDAVKQKMSQSTRVGSSPNYNSSASSISSSARPGPPPDYGVRGSSASRGSSQVRVYGSQNVNLDTRYQTSNRAMSVPLHQRRSDKSIRLSPQGDLGREMSICGKPPASNDILPEVPLNSHHGQTLKSSRQSSFTGSTSNQTNYQATAGAPKIQSWGTADHALPILVTTASPVGQMHTPSTAMNDICYEAIILPEEILQEKAILTIKEFYSAKDEKEVGLCMKELNAPSFYPSLVSLWINDSFERKDLERELLAKLLVNLCKSQESLLSERVLLQGFQNVLSTLEDAVTDAPKATEFLGRIFAKVILEDVLSLTEVGVLLQDGGEEPASDQKLASEVLGSMLESIRVERGDSAMDEISARSKPHPENLRQPGLCA
ncbi:eukaryotic translation initiation factor 4G [Aegilops tauschii subsp. strangulata]|uniref:Eukaryotic translation initiation factor 4G n=2 Tax=Aegilops tauschii subsp. strangulata TaxID=200361 RepID=A0A453CJE0_AEGTS|nr:eukaryotic translation initiation factor 4G [Aegilops tauschii subsp. strangulata]